MATAAERIKQLRKQKKLSQAELASLIGVKNNTVSTWERGTRKPDFDALDGLSRVFEVSFEYILGESNDSTPRRKPTQAELNELEESVLADEIYDMVKMYCRLDEKSQILIQKYIAVTYEADKKDGSLSPEDPFEIKIVPKKNEL